MPNTALPSGFNGPYFALKPPARTQGESCP